MRNLHIVRAECARSARAISPNRCYNGHKTDGGGLFPYAGIRRAGRVPRRGGRPAKNRGQNGNGGMKGWRRHRECGSAHMRRLCLERQSGLPELRGRQKGRISLQDGGRATLADGKRGSRFANGEIRQVLRSRYAEGRGIPKGGGGADRETAAPLIKRALLPGRYDEAENGRFPRSGDLSRAQSLTRRRRLAAVFRPAHEPAPRRGEGTQFERMF